MIVRKHTKDGLETNDVWKLYEATAEHFIRRRSRFVGEERYLEVIAAGLGANATVLDLGCGSGVPIAEFFVQRGFDLTGVDAAPAMVAVCREQFPGATFIHADMRRLALGRRFDAIIAFNSFFHLPAEDQRKMFAVFRDHAAAGAFLFFSSGPKAGEAIGDLYGHALYHASLDEAEYRRHLDENGFEVLVYRAEDPACGGHTVWLARQRGGEAR